MRRRAPLALAALVALVAFGGFVAAGRTGGREGDLAELGRLLFFDRRLSRSGLLSCSECHSPHCAYTDGRRRAVGLVGPGDVNTPTLANVRARPRLMVAGAIGGLEEQAKKAILERGEMGGMEAHEVERRVAGIAGYRTLFRAAFGSEEITLDRIATAIATFERTIVSRDSDYDRFREGRAALTREARIGLDLFFGRGRCFECHSGPDFTDDGYHATGSTSGTTSMLRGRQSVTARAEDAGKIRTPTLREIASTAPYFHDGSMPDLESVVRFYEAGGRPHPNKDDRIRPLALTREERDGLVAFLRSLSGRGWIEVPPPSLPR